MLCTMGLYSTGIACAEVSLSGKGGDVLEKTPGVVLFFQREIKGEQCAVIKSAVYVAASHRRGDLLVYIHERVLELAVPADKVKLAPFQGLSVRNRTQRQDGEENEDRFFHIGLVIQDQGSV